MNRLFRFPLLLLLGVLSSCSHIDEADRLVLVSKTVVADSTNHSVDPADSLYDLPPTPLLRRILIEDHTGQHCPNCPEAATIIDRLQHRYGDRIVPVAIHSAMQGIMEPEGLANDLGNALYQQWAIEYKPAALFNRLDDGTGNAAFPKTLYEQAVAFFAGDSVAAPLDVRVKASQDSTDPTRATIFVKVLATTSDASIGGRLHVWITEDNIVAPQDSTGTTIASYVHQHVLRAAATTLQGESLTVSPADPQHELRYDVDISPRWKPSDLAVVAFVCDGAGVVQCVRRKFTSITNH